MDQSNSSEFQATVNVPSDQGAGLAGTNREAVTSEEYCFSGMDLDVYKAAKEGNVDALWEQKEHLHHILTPTKNTVLHIYIACALSTKPREVQKSTNIVERMLEMCPSLLVQRNGNGDTALHTAARHGGTAIVELLIKAAKEAHHGDVEGAWPGLMRTSNEEGNTALHEAVRFNHFDVVVILTTQDNHQFFDYANAAGETPLYMAAERGHRDLVFQILHTCTNVAYQGPNGRTALHAAVIRNDREMTSKLLESTRVLTNELDERGCTPLHLAASLGYTSIVKQLLEHDRSAAYVREKDEKRTALHFAASKGYVDVMRQLISHCPDCCELVDDKCRNVLHCGIMADQDNVVDFVLEDPWLSNILLNGKDNNGDTPLHYHADTSFIRISSGLETDARVDKMAFNKANQNAFDILLRHNGEFYSSSTHEEVKDKLKRNGATHSCRIARNKEEVEETREKKVIDDKYSKFRDSHLVVATLIATVSFAAGFTIPGGYQSDKGSPDQGSAILTKNAVFQAFVITNTIAMCLSSCSVLLHLIGYFKRHVMSEAHAFLYCLTMLALIAMVIAFITGTYAALGRSSRLGITVCVIGCVLFFVLVEFIIYDERGMMEITLTFVPLSLLFYVFGWLVMKIFYLIRKIFYQCLLLVCPASKGKWSKLMVASRSSSLLRRETDNQMIVYNRC